MEKAFSSALSTSGSANESSRPESNNDSSGSGVVFFLETVRIISVICACLVIGFRTGKLIPHFRVFFVIVHEIAEERVSEPLVTRRGEMHVIALGESSRHPFAHSAFPAHFLSHVPKGAPIRHGRLALGSNDSVQLFHIEPATSRAIVAIRRTEH